jgi:hypothetical protein
MDNLGDEPHRPYKLKLIEVAIPLQGGLFTGLVCYAKFIIATACQRERWPVSRKD